MKTIEIYIDEAGRWPWAGPVTVCGVVVVDKELNLDLYDDSKVLKSTTREELYDEIVRLSSSWSIYFRTASCSAQIIDKYGIVYALRKSIDHIATYFTKVFGDRYGYKLIIDGNRTFGLEKKRDVETIIDGDALIKQISMASIVAKVIRDRMMIRYDKKYPLYWFARHKWYGTKLHASAILEHWICPIHRLSYLKNILQN